MNFSAAIRTQNTRLVPTATHCAGNKDTGYIFWLLIQSVPDNVSRQRTHYILHKGIDLFNLLQRCSVFRCFQLQGKITLYYKGKNSSLLLRLLSAMLVQS